MDVMDFFAIIIAWPLFILVIGLVFISAADISSMFILPMVLVFLFILLGLKGRLGGAAAQTQVEDLDKVRRGAATFSIALLLPIFVKYLLAASDKSLAAMILALIFGFGVVIWGMFIKNNKVLVYANSIGGALVIIYLYFELWSLGQLAQVIAAAFGLVVAVVVSIIKFREKLT